MFLLLAPSLLTGKRPGLYCLGGRGSQDIPKGPKGEVRGWIVRHDKESTLLLLFSQRTHSFKIQSKKLRLFLFYTMLHFKSHSGIKAGGNEIRTMNSLVTGCPDSTGKKLMLTHTCPLPLRKWH